MITDKDIQKLQTVFDTKNELDNKLDSMENRINDKLTEMRLSLMQVFHRNMQELLEELKAQRTSWRNHDKRISRLEDQVGITTP